MTFNPLDSTLRVNVVKDALFDEFYSSSLKENERLSKATTVVIETVRPVTIFDLTFTKAVHGLAVNATVANVIRNQLVSSGYLDSKYYVTTLFSYKKAFNFTFPKNHPNPIMNNSTKDEPPSELLFPLV